MRYGQCPVVIASDIHTVNDYNEPFFYQDMPFKMAKDECINKLEDRLMIFDRMIRCAIDDFIAIRGVQALVDSYVYITAKRQFIQPGCSYNREGYHCDGFGTDDINYIWSDMCPTVFNSSDFNLSADDSLSMIEMTEQAKKCNEYVYPNNTLLRLDKYNVHKVGEITQPCYRTFLKLSFSKDKYNLIGNSHNHLISYNWEMRPRGMNRNVPQDIKVV